MRSCLHHGSIPVALQCARVTAGLPQSALLADAFVSVSLVQHLLTTIQANGREILDLQGLDDDESEDQ